MTDSDPALAAFLLAAAARRDLRRRLLGLFPGVLLEWPSDNRKLIYGRYAPDLIPPGGPASEPPGQWAPGTPGAQT